MDPFGNSGSWSVRTPSRFTIGLSGGDGRIPFPSPGEKVLGGHAVLAVGYDDQIKFGKQKGALLIRDSWGSTWGDKGCGWVPYAYVDSALATDW